MPERYIALIQNVLSPDLLKPEYRELNIGNPMYGHCYAATEALFHLIGGLDSGWFPVRGKDENGITHWWLQNQEDLIADPTAEQYISKGLTPPYPNGVRGGFMTGYDNPSKRATIIMQRVSDLQI